MKKKQFIEERREEIVTYLNQNKRADVAELADKFDVTDVTIRRDLILLEEEGRLIRTHGGAMSSIDRAVWETTNILARLENETEAKNQIAMYVAETVKDGDSLFMDSGSTNLLISRALLSRKRLMVVTNSPTIAQTFAGVNENSVIITGGTLDKNTDSIIGPSCIESINRYRTDKAIIGISGVLIPDGYFGATPEEAAVKQQMMKNAKVAMVVSDSTKIGTTAFAFVQPLLDTDVFVTDSHVKPEYKQAMIKHGVNIVTV